MSSLYNIEYKKYKKYKKNYKNFNYGGSGRTKLQFDDNISRNTIEFLQRNGYFIYDINITRQFPPQKVSQMESIITTLNNLLKSAFTKQMTELGIKTTNFNRNEIEKHHYEYIKYQLRQLPYDNEYTTGILEQTHSNFYKNRNSFYYFKDENLHLIEKEYQNIFLILGFSADVRTKKKEKEDIDDVLFRPSVDKHAISIGLVLNKNPKKDNYYFTL